MMSAALAAAVGIAKSVPCALTAVGANDFAAHEGDRFEVEDSDQG